MVYRNVLEIVTLERSIYSILGYSRGHELQAVPRKDENGLEKQRKREKN